MSLCLVVAAGLSICAMPCPPEPIDPLTVAAVLRDAATVVHGHAPSRARLAMGWAQVRLETGPSSRCHNLGSIGAVGAQPFWMTGGARFAAWPDYIEGAQAYWRAVSPAALQHFDAGDAMGAAVALGRAGYHRSDPAWYGESLRGLYGAGLAAVGRL